MRTALFLDLLLTENMDCSKDVDLRSLEVGYLLSREVRAILYLQLMTELLIEEPPMELVLTSLSLITLELNLCRCCEYILVSPILSASIISRVFYGSKSFKLSLLVFGCCRLSLDTDDMLLLELWMLEP